MAISALFTIEGTTTPAEVTTTYGATVDLALLSTTGVKAVWWEIIGVSSNLTLASAPSISLSGSPAGITASFVADSDPGDGKGIGYNVKCSVSDGKNTAVSYGIVGVAGDVSGRVPPTSGETLARDAVKGWMALLDDAVSAAWSSNLNITFGSGYIGIGATTATTGFVRGPNNDGVYQRSTTGANIRVIGLASDNHVRVNFAATPEGNTYLHGLSSVTSYVWDGAAYQARFIVGSSSASFNYGGSDITFGDGWILIPNELRSGATAVGTSLGSVTHKMPVYDAAGALVGYVPIYDAITT